MKTARLQAVIATLCGFLALSSCSLAYDIEIVVRRGTIVFVPYQLGMFGRRLSDTPKVERLIVEQISRKPETVWEVRSPDINGTSLSELTYGKLPAGFEERTSPAKLQVGQLYLATVMALGGGGDRYFVISPYSGYAESPEVTFLDAQSVPE